MFRVDFIDLRSTVMLYQISGASWGRLNADFRAKKGLMDLSAEKHAQLLVRWVFDNLNPGLLFKHIKLYRALDIDC